jgi:hypothetical protein
MTNRNGLEGVPVNTAAHTIEMTMVARVLTDDKGVPQKVFLEGDQGVKAEWPGYAFPFIKNGHTILIVTTIVQVSKADPAKPALIRPQG